MGAGVVWERDRVVTNAHVVRSDQVQLETIEGQRLPAHVELLDSWRDLALLEAAGTLNPIALGDEETLRPGSLVVGLGHPLGWTGAISLGIVHRVDRDGARGHPRWIRADVRLEPGNSGGPLADAHGRLIGINTMVVQGLGLAIPVSAVRRFLLPRDQRPRLGVRLQPVSVHGRRRGRFGLIVVGVTKHSAAEGAGVNVGDVILSVDGFDLLAPYDFADAITLAPSAPIRLALLRAGHHVELDVNADPPARAA
jgi:serine protease Do